MNIPDEVIEVVTGMHPEQREYPDDVRKDFHTAAEWARKEALKEAAAFVKSEIERLELVKGTYAKAQRHALGMVWGHIRADALAEGVSDGQQ